MGIARVGRVKVGRVKVGGRVNLGHPVLVASDKDAKQIIRRTRNNIFISRYKWLYLLRYAFHNVFDFEIISSMLLVHGYL